MAKEQNDLNVKIRKVKVEDIKEVYRLLVENRPYVGLNSRYTYFLLARDFSDTCVVAEHKGKIIGFSSGYVSPARNDTFFNWESVVHKDYRGNSLQKQMLLHQIKNANVEYFEGTVNPSNKVSEKNFFELAELLNAKCHKRVLFKEEDFENDGHETETLCRIGPIPQNCRVSAIIKGL
ncbi:MAG: diaminobutyrate acetyltransferase [Candidatus Bathyarchaeota archaeon]|nr:diaminobutyrate acetyltransferase [Candidatus Bathyarchaeum sp.]